MDINDTQNSTLATAEASINSLGEPVIQIRFYDGDVTSIAEMLDVPEQVARDRVASWATAISDTAVESINEQLESVIKYNQP
jgi:hypothetical protein